MKNQTFANCKFDPPSPIASSDVREMLIDFKGIEEIDAMLPTVAYAAVQVHFDFRSKSIMDPYGGENTIGVAYNE